MTALERIRNTVAGRPVDHLSAQPLVVRFAAASAGIPYIQYARDAHKLAEAQLRTAEAFGIDCVLTYSDGAREVMDIAGPDSIDWTDDGPAVNASRAALQLPVTLREFRCPNPFGGGRMHEQNKAIEILRARSGEGQSIIGWIEGPMSLAAQLRGFDAMMHDLKHDSPFANDLLDFTAEVGVRFADAQIRSGADSIAIGGTAAATAAMGPELYETWAFSRHLRIIEAIKARHPQVIVRLHLHGRVEPMLTKLAQLPVDVFQLDSVADMATARSWLGQGRVIAGNVAIDELGGTPRKVQDAAKKCHKACGACHIVSTAGEVPPSTPPENLRALIAYAREH